MTRARTHDQSEAAERRERVYSHSTSQARRAPATRLTRRRAGEVPVDPPGRARGLGAGVIRPGS